jgi:uncharacterized paraquat-inducible protein A
MARDLDDILATLDCPACGATISVRYEQLRIHKAVGCRCGAFIAVKDETPIAAVQRLIDEANPPAADNDA